MDEARGRHRYGGVLGLDKREPQVLDGKRHDEAGWSVALLDDFAAICLVDIRIVEHEWLATAAGVPGFIGFAVGRTDFWDPLVAWRSGKASRDEAIAEIAGRYREFVELFESRQS